MVQDSSKSLAVSQPYLDRYQQETSENSSSYEFDASQDTEVFSDEAFQEKGELFRRMSEGEATDATDFGDVFSELDDIDEALGEFGADQDLNPELAWDPQLAISKIETLEQRLQDSHLKASQKENFLEKITAVRNQLASGELQDDFVIEELADDLENLFADNPSLQQKLVDALASRSDLDLTEEKVALALKAAEIDEASLTKLQLPMSRKNSSKIINLLKDLDPNFADSLASEPYKAENIGQLKAFLTLLLGESAVVKTETAVQLLDQTTSIGWKGEQFKEQISGDWVESHQSFMDRLSAAVDNKDVDGQLHSYMWSGFNDVDRGQHNRNDEVRRAVSVMFEAAGRNPYLLRRYLKLLPEKILQDMRDTVIYHNGELNEVHSGDLFDSSQTSKIIDWAIVGGEIPNELAGTMFAPASSSPAAPNPPTA